MKIYDNGGDTLDRYTIFIDDEADDCVGASEHGSGFYQHSVGTRGDHLGQEVQFTNLSPELQAKLLPEIRGHLEYLRRELQQQRISYGELAELASLEPFIEPGDVELLEAAGVLEEDADKEPGQRLRA